MIAPNTKRLGELLRAIKVAASWSETDRAAPALLDGAALKKAATDLALWANANATHDGAKAAAATADLATAAASLPLHEHSRDARAAVEKAARITQLAGGVAHAVGDSVAYVHTQAAAPKTNTDTKPSARQR